MANETFSVGDIVSFCIEGSPVKPYGYARVMSVDYKGSIQRVEPLVPLAHPGMRLVDFKKVHGV